MIQRKTISSTRARPSPTRQDDNKKNKIAPKSSSKILLAFWGGVLLLIPSLFLLVSHSYLGKIEGVTYDDSSPLSPHQEGETKKNNSVATGMIDYYQDKEEIPGGGKNTEDIHRDKERIMDMLREMNIDPYSLDNQTWASIPTWERVQEIWGTAPVVYGLEHCATFRKEIPPEKRYIAVAGIFSTGTNLLAQLLQHNCAIPERVKTHGTYPNGQLKKRHNHGMEWQVPWGKHNPFRYRGKHGVKNFKKEEKMKNAKIEHYLPAVTIRDPYMWMSSMCGHPYTLSWKHSKKQCPNMVQNEVVVPLTARFGADVNKQNYASLANVWNEWYGEYFHNEQKIPALMVRFEDVIFYPRETTQQVCECAGGELMKPLKAHTDTEASVGNFHYVVGNSISGRGHGSVANQQQNGMVKAYAKYAMPRKKRLEPFMESDINFAKKTLDKDMMITFRYDQ